MSPPSHKNNTPALPKKRRAAPGLPDPRAQRTGHGPVPAGLSPSEKAALAWSHTARFLTTASQLDQLPAHDLPEVAFVGRSNAGKSSAINTLTQQRQLAFASKTPGRTQHINLFALGPREAPQLLLADLPGYGYAAVARDAKLRWQQVMADYLAYRRNLGGVVQLVDSRHGLTDLDLQLLAFVQPRVRSGEVKLLVLLTKIDKLGRKAAAQALRSAQDALADLATDSADIGVLLFSAPQRTGLADLACTVQGWANVAPVPSPAAPVDGLTP